jgi:ABC-type transport system substrate-binding protein
VFDQSITLTSRGDTVLSEEMERQGIRLLTSPSPTVYYYAFNMTDKVVGGYTEARKKLRRAIAIAFDMEEEIAIFSNGRGQVAHSPTPPGIFGYEEGEAGINPFVYRWDKARDRAVRRSLDEAKRLLAEAGYPDGYGPDGKPLVIRFDNAWTSAARRPRLRFVVNQFAKLGIRLETDTTDYNRFQEKVLAGNIQMCSWGWAADYPDPENFLFLLYGPNGKVVSGSENSANYANPEFDNLLVQMRAMDNTPERLAIIRRMNHILHEDAPWIAAYHPVSYSLVHEWCRNAYPNPVAFNTLKYLRIDPELRARGRAKWNRPRWGPLVVFFAALALATVPALRAAVRHVREG